MPVPMNLTEDIEALELFNEKADKLRNLSFVSSLLSAKSGWQVLFQEGTVTTSNRYGPGNESIEAFLLTFRFFIQDNEPTSIRMMARRYRRLHEGLLIPQELLENFDNARNWLLNYVNSDTPIKFSEADTIAMALTRTEVFEVFIWGGLAHANKHKKKKFDSWREDSNQIIFPALEHEFVMILTHYLRAIRYARRLNNRVLAIIRPRQQEL
jgi:hypothetical protein